MDITREAVEDKAAQMKVYLPPVKCSELSTVPPSKRGQAASAKRAASLSSAPIHPAS